MDGSRLMGLAMFVPIIGLPQGHGNRKTIKTIPYVPLNTNNVLLCHQQLKQGSFFSAQTWPPYRPIYILSILSSFLKLFSTKANWAKVESSTLICNKVSWSRKEQSKHYLKKKDKKTNMQINSEKNAATVQKKARFHRNPASALVLHSVIAH